MRPCPACGRKIQDAAQHCHYCHAVVAPARRPDRPSPSAISPAAEQAPKSRVGAALFIVLLIAVVVAALAIMLR
jgi:hypothetical protein